MNIQFPLIIVIVKHVLCNNHYRNTVFGVYSRDHSHLKSYLSHYEVILATEEVITSTLKVILATTKVLLATKEAITHILNMI